MSKFLKQQAYVQDTFNRLHREVHELIYLYNIGNTDIIMLMSAVEARAFEKDVTAYRVWKDLMHLDIVDKEYYEKEYKKRTTPLWRAMHVNLR